MKIDILKKLETAKTEQDREWIAMQFTMEGLKPELRKAIYAAAIPHWFDINFLNALLGKPLGESDFQVLIHLSFIEDFPDRGWNMHERTRELLRCKIWKKDKKRYLKLSRQAAIYCANQDQNKIFWRIETLYHSLIAGNTNAVSDFISQLNDWRNRFEYDKLEALLMPVLQAVKNQRISKLAAAWAYYYQARLDIRYSRYQDAKNNLNNALQKATEGIDMVVANCFESLGDINQIMAEYDDARKLYEKAFFIFAQNGDQIGQANCIKARGDIYKMLAEYDDARKQYEKSFDIYKNVEDPFSEANCIKALGDIYSNLDEYDDAKNWYNEALCIYTKIGDHHGEASCIKALGDIHTNLAQYDAAHQLYEEALGIYTKNGIRLEKIHCIMSLGELYGELGEIEKALSMIEEASENYRQLGLNMDVANCFNSIGDLFFNSQKYDDAIRYYSKAIEHASKGAWWYRNRSATMMRIEKYEAAAEDLKIAEKYQPNAAHLYLLKGILNLWQKNFNMSNAFFKKAVSLHPKNGECHFYLALALIVDNQMENAFMELEKAVNNTYKVRQLKDFLNELGKLGHIYGTSYDVEKMYARLNEKLSGISQPYL